MPADPVVALGGPVGVVQGPGEGDGFGVADEPTERCSGLRVVVAVSM
jgi:hypothetical protein